MTLLWRLPWWLLRLLARELLIRLLRLLACELLVWLLGLLARELLVGLLIRLLSRRSLLSVGGFVGVCHRWVRRLALLVACQPHGHRVNILLNHDAYIPSTLRLRARYLMGLWFRMSHCLSFYSGPDEVTCPAECARYPR